MVPKGGKSCSSPIGKKCLAQNFNAKLCCIAQKDTLGSFMQSLCWEPSPPIGQILAPSLLSVRVRVGVWVETGLSSMENHLRLDKFIS